MSWSMKTDPSGQKGERHGADGVSGPCRGGRRRPARGARGGHERAEAADRGPSLDRDQHVVARGEPPDEVEVRGGLAKRAYGDRGGKRRPGRRALNRRPSSASARRGAEREDRDARALLHHAPAPGRISRARPRSGMSRGGRPRAPRRGGSGAGAIALSRARRRSPPCARARPVGRRHDASCSVGSRDRDVEKEARMGRPVRAHQTRRRSITKRTGRFWMRARRDDLVVRRALERSVEVRSRRTFCL